MEYIKGKLNVVADAASRLQVGELSAPLDDAAFEMAHTLPQAFQCMAAELS